MFGDPVHPKRGLLFSPFFFYNAHHQRGSSQPHSFSVTSWQLFTLCAPRPSWMVTSSRDLIPSCRIPTTRAAMTSLCSFKASPAFRGVPHTSTCALPFRNLRHAPCEQNTLHRPHRALQTHSPREPVRIKFTIQPTFCPSAGSTTCTACVSGLGFTCADAHVAALCVAQHGPRARCCANPARLPK